MAQPYSQKMLWFTELFHRIGINISLPKCILNLTQLPYIQPKKTTGVSGFLHPAGRSGDDQTQPHRGAEALQGTQGMLPPHRLQGRVSQKQRAQFQGKEAGTLNSGDTRKKEAIACSSCLLGPVS